MDWSAKQSVDVRAREQAGAEYPAGEGWEGVDAAEGKLLMASKYWDQWAADRAAKQQPAHDAKEEPMSQTSGMIPANTDNVRKSPTKKPSKPKKS